MSRVITTCALLSLTAAALAAAGCRTNPVSGGIQLSRVSASDELALGNKDHPAVIFMYDGQYHDPELTRYLGTIVRRLQQCSHRPDLPVDFAILNTSVINAFALPGHVYVTRGFLARIDSEGEFAAVMGHELALVAAGHSARRLSRNVLSSVVTNPADSLTGTSAAAQVVLGAGQVGVSLLGPSYSREQEIQADRVGAYYMALAGWDPRQAIVTQQLLGSISKRSGSVMDRYLYTHPPTLERVAEIGAVIQEKHLRSYVQGDGVYAGRWTRHLAGLREVDRAFGPYDRGVKALAEKQYAQALAAAEESLRMRSDQAPPHRLKGDALLGLGRTAEAKAAYGEALRLDPRYVFAHVGLAKAYDAEGDKAAVQREVQEINRQLPGAL